MKRSLGTSSLPREPPVGALPEVPRPVPRGHRDLGYLLAPVLAALERPALLPRRPPLHPRRRVAEHGEERHRLLLRELGDEPGHVEVGPPAIQLGYLHEVGVLAHAVGQAPAAREPRLGPVAGILQAIEEPAAKGPLFLLLPGLGVPAALVLGLLDDGNAGIGPDRLDAALDELPVVFGPLRRDLGDRRGAVALEPRRRELPGCHPSREYDLEGALSELDSREVLPRVREIVLREAVEAIALPVEFLLETDHLFAQGRGQCPSLVQPITRQRSLAGNRRRLD
jgi:hypothetical protein